MSYGIFRVVDGKPIRLTKNGKVLIFGQKRFAMDAVATHESKSNAYEPGVLVVMAVAQERTMARYGTKKRKKKGKKKK